MPRHKLYTYQKESVYAAEREFGGRILLADATGLGKSVQTCWYLHRNPHLRPAVIVCPASVKYGWESEIQNNMGIRPAVLEGQTPVKFGRNPPPILIINHDILRHWVAALIDIYPQFVGLDEGQNFGNRTAKRTKAARALTKNVPSLWVLTATPLQNRPAELWPALNMLWPAEFASFWSFAHEFCDARRGFWGWTYKGAKNVDALHQLLRRLGMIRRLKRDVLQELPACTRRVLPVPMSDPLEYRRAQDDFITWLAKQDPGRARAAARAKKVTQMGYLRRLAAQLKIDAVVEWINNFLSGGEKLAVFAVHRGMIKALRERCKAKSVVLDGSVTGLLRKQVVQQFKNDKGTRLFLGNIQASGTGLDGLQHVCSTAAIVEMPWKPGECLQLEGRLDRIGQEQLSFMNYLVARGTIEEYLCELNQEKQAVISGVLDGGADAGLAFDVYDQLCARMLEDRFAA